MEHNDRPVSASRTTLSQVMMPEDANADANIHGGTIMKFADTAAAVAAIRHSRKRVVTARVDGMNFLAPVYVGNLVHGLASVNMAGRTSMEVGVRIEAEDARTGEVRHVASAFFVYVALDDAGKPSSVPGLIAETEEDRRRLADAVRRDAGRQAERRRVREASTLIKSEN
ncbi:MAG: acyl-CoA thioesterase [Chloroflexota bacterium]